MDIRDRLGERVQKVRESQKLSRVQLAERLGVTRMTIFNIETGAHAVNVDTLQALAKALGVTEDRLVKP